MLCKWPLVQQIWFPPCSPSSSSNHTYRPPSASQKVSLVSDRHTYYLSSVYLHPSFHLVNVYSSFRSNITFSEVTFPILSRPNYLRDHLIDALSYVWGWKAFRVSTKACPREDFRVKTQKQTDKWQLYWYKKRLCVATRPIKTYF